MSFLHGLVMFNSCWYWFAHYLYPNHNLNVIKFTISQQHVKFTICVILIHNNIYNPMFRLSCLVCSQIWLNHLMDDHHFSYITKLKKKKPHAYTIIVLSFLGNSISLKLSVNWCDQGARMASFGRIGHQTHNQE